MSTITCPSCDGTGTIHKAAKLYAVADMPQIVDALVHVLHGVTAREVVNG